MIRIESLLSARLVLQPQLVSNRIFFISNLHGQLSLYSLFHGGSMPEPLLPPHIALQNPHLIGGKSFCVFPRLNKILIMIDADGDENYQPMVIPIEGGFPEQAFDGIFSNFRVHLAQCDLENDILYLMAESRTEQLHETYQCNLAGGTVSKIGESTWGAYPSGVNKDHTRVILVDTYIAGDNVLYLWSKTTGEKQLLYGIPMEARLPGQEVPLNAIGGCFFTENNRGLVCSTALFSDNFGLGYLNLSNPAAVQEVEINGIMHTGTGEFEGLEELEDNRYLLQFNIDGCTWLYEGNFNETTLEMNIERAITGVGQISNGVLESCSYDKVGDRFAISFSTATSPTQIYTVEGSNRQAVIRHTNERVLGIPSATLSPGEDASFTSYDGLRISARLYLPPGELGFEGPRPLVYYIHGGPQSQERPDFAWFSIPLIQFLTLNGFAVFVPNVRGSTGYGLSYLKKVDHDWGGQDRLDHVHAMKHILPRDSRLDVTRTGVVGRSYGGYMSLTLSGRHPELWKAAVDMFGPYDLLTFADRVPETWKPFIKIALGDPEKEEDRRFLIERSPRTYLQQLSCPMLVIQGRNDPRVIERESRDLVEYLQNQGKKIELLVFENEGHDVLKYGNRVICYNAITDFLTNLLKP